MLYLMCDLVLYDSPQVSKVVTHYGQRGKTRVAADLEAMQPPEIPEAGLVETGVPWAAVRISMDAISVLLFAFMVVKTYVPGSCMGHVSARTGC